MWCFLCLRPHQESNLDLLLRREPRSPFHHVGIERNGWDSNPRGSSRNPICLANRPLKPLGYHSLVGMTGFEPALSRPPAARLNQTWPHPVVFFVFMAGVPGIEPRAVVLETTMLAVTPYPLEPPACSRYTKLGVPSPELNRIFWLRRVPRTRTSSSCSQSTCATLNTCTRWSSGGDLNSRPLPSEGSALPN